VFAFALLLGASIWGMLNVQIGLDQRTPLPTDSYLITFFDKQEVRVAAVISLWSCVVAWLCD
jgi:hypothetical protein